MRRFRLALLLLSAVLAAPAAWTQSESARPAPRIILPGAPLVPAAPGSLIVLPQTPILQAPPAIIVAARPLTPAELAATGLPSSDELKALVASLSPSGTAEEAAARRERQRRIAAAFDGAPAPEAAHWDDLSAEFAQGPLAPPLPVVEKAARSLIARLLPRFYRRVPVESAYDRRDQPLTHHHWDARGGHRIEIAPAAADSRGDVLSAFGAPGETRVQQKIERLLGYAHEYAHVLFDSGIGREREQLAFSVHAAMTEGFAVSLERKLVERMVERAPALGLTPRDAMDLSAVASARRTWLAANDNHYSEGVLAWRAVEERGGEQGMLSFLAALSAGRLIGVTRLDPAYQLALGHPESLAAYLGGDPAERRGLEAVAKAASGGAVDETERRAAADAVERAGADGRRRVFERTLRLDKRLAEGPVEPAFALARVSPTAAAELARFLAETIVSPAGPARLFGRPGPSDRLSAVVAGAESLPWDEASRRSWLDGLTRWLMGRDARG